MSPGLVVIAMSLSFALTLALTWVGLKCFPHFVSSEEKVGIYKGDRGEKDGSGRLPGVGGPSIIMGVSITLASIAYFHHLDGEQVAILIASLWLFGIVGFVDDLSKKVRGRGIEEGAKWVGVGLASLLVALLLYWRLGFDQPYPPYSDWPFLGRLTENSVAWGVSFFLLAVVVMAVSSLSANMSDGLDGLTGGLGFIAAAAYIIILAGRHNPALAAFCAGLVGASAGFLRWNWPSNWTRTVSIARRAQAYLGDSGAMTLGGALAVVALLSKAELLWFVMGGVFVLEGGSAHYQARIITRFFRKFLKLARYSGVGAFVPHTEFPLPFRATPLHYHFDLLKLPRVWTVYGFWFAGLVLAVLCVASYLAGPFWLKAVLVGLGLVFMAACWTLGMWTKNCFLAFWPEVGEDRRVALYIGKPYQLAGWNLYRMQEKAQLTESSVQDLQSVGLLWRSLSVCDAYATLGYLHYRRNEYAEAAVWWQRIDPPNLSVRPHIQTLLQDALERSRGTSP